MGENLRPNVKDTAWRFGSWLICISCSLGTMLDDSDSNSSNSVDVVLGKPDWKTDAFRFIIRSRLQLLMIDRCKHLCYKLGNTNA